MCLFFSNLKVVFDTRTLISKKFSPVGLKAYIGILRPLALTDVNLCVCLLIYLCSFADSMLGRLNKKDVATTTKKMKETTKARPVQDLKLKVVAEVVPAPTEDEETYSESVFKRRCKADTEPSEHSVLDGRAPSPQAPLPSPPHSRDMVVVQEDEGTSAPEGRLWDPSLDAPSFLKKILLSAKAKEKLESLEEDQPVEQAVRQLGQALAANCLAISKMRGWKGSAKEESHKVVELSQQVEGLKQETARLLEELQRTQEEAMTLLTENSKEALELSNKNTELQAEVERLKGELTKKDEELIRKGEE